MLELLLGAFLAILGGWGAIWFQQRYARKIRMDEITAERKVTANAEAYAYVKEVKSSLLQKNTEDTLKLVLAREEWFFSNRLFLPGKFPAKWLSIRNDLHRLKRWQGGASKTPEEITALEEQIEQSATDAIDEIYEDMNLERIELRDTEAK